MIAGQEFSGNERAYLLGAVGRMLKQADLIERDREMFEHLRDRLAVGLDIKPDLRSTLGLDDQDPVS